MTPGTFWTLLCWESPVLTASEGLNLIIFSGCNNHLISQKKKDPRDYFFLFIITEQSELVMKANIMHAKTCPFFTLHS